MSSPLVARLRRANLWAYFFVLPAFAFYLAFSLIPLAGTMGLSLYKWDGASPHKTWVGLANYVEMFRDPITGLAFLNTLIWMVMSYAIQISTALLLAVLIAAVARGQSFFRVTLFLPKVLSVAVVAVVWGRIYDPFIGIVNTTLRDIGLGSLARGWLGDTTFALPAIQIAHSWNGYGWYMVVYLAALQAIEPVLYEAADIEGASGWQKFRWITLPGIRHVHTLVLVLSMIASLQTFGTVWAMTEGGPFHASEVISTHIYKTAFMGNRVGYGAAMSLVMGIVIIAFTWVTMRLREEKEG
jgi:raffinose/stachyose/melibiose transport system permease protein